MERRRGLLIALAVVAAPVALAAAQVPAPVRELDALRGIPPPPPMVIRPGAFAAYGALLTTATLTTLYLYRGRAFIVYWIGSWLMFAGSLALLARGYSDVRLGSVMLGLGHLLAVWSAGLLWLAAAAFPEAPLRWTMPLRVGASTAVWFLVAPFVLPLPIVLATGPAAAAVLMAGAAARYVRVGVQTRYVGVIVIALGMVVLSGTNAGAAAVSLNVFADPQAINRVLGFNIIVYVFVALGMHVLVFEDMTDALRRAHSDLAQAHQEMKRLVITDPLTGCHNRRFFEEIERREIQRHRRYGAPLSVIFIDVDHFKQLNDSYGHDVGDRVLKAIGSMLRHNVRESDYVVRWGGDEFVLLLTCGLPEAQRKANDLTAAFARERREASLPAEFGLSIGVAPVPPDSDSFASAIRLADTRMYEQKTRERQH